MRWVVIFTLAALLAACRSTSGSSTEPPRPLQLIDGPGVRRLVEETGARSGVVVNFWATWCEPCKEEFPIFVRVAQTYADRGVRVHFVSLDFPEERLAALAFLESQGVQLPSYAKVGKDHPFITAIHPRWSGVLPATFIYGPDKELRHFWEGKIDEPTLTKALDRLVAEASQK